MKTPLAVFALAAVATLSPVRSFADPADDFLVRAETIPSKGAKFVSFVPSDDWCDASWLTNRLRRWKERVADRVGAVDGSPLSASDIEVRAWTEPVRARIVVGVPFAGWLEPGGRGCEILALDGGSSVVTNGFSLESADPDEATCELVLKPGGGSFRLDSSQGAGAGVWLLSRQELEKRWERRLPADGDAVRAEIWSVRKDRAKGAGSDAWRRETASFLAKHPAVWPGIRFLNATGSGVMVELLHGGARIGDAGEAPAGGDCTNRIDRKVDGKTLQWRGWPVDSGLCGDDYESRFVRDDAQSAWSPTALENHLTVSVDETNLKRKPPPRLELGDRLFPAGALRSLDEDNVRVAVSYADEPGGETDCPIRSDNGRLFAEIVPHRAVSQLAIRLVGVPGLPAETLLEPVEPEWCCGETVATDGRVDWLPWPEVSFRNNGIKTVRHAIRLQDAGGRELLSAPVVLQLAPGETKPFRPRGRLPDAPSLTMRVESSAEACDDKATVLKVLRGEPFPFSPDLSPRTYPWPVKDVIRWIPVVTAEKAFREYRSGATFKALRFSDERHNYLAYHLYGTATNLLPSVAAVFPEKGAPVEPNTTASDWYKGDEVASRFSATADATGRFAVSADDVFAVVRDHLNTCLGGEECACRAFRASNGDWLAPIGESTPDDSIYMALFNDWMANAPQNMGKPKQDKAKQVENRASVLGCEKRNGGGEK